MLLKLSKEAYKGTLITCSLRVLRWYPKGKATDCSDRNNILKKVTGQCEALFDDTLALNHFRQRAPQRIVN